MAIVVYKCDTCKRTVELIRNIYGLETPHRCTITLGCRGKLYQSHLHVDYTRATLPESVSGLDDWQQRKVLYNHTQTIENDSWMIVHNLGSYPAVSVFVNRPTSADPNNQDEIVPDDIVIVSPDIISLRFDRAWSGVAQLVARSSDPQLIQATRTLVQAEAPQTMQISSGGNIVIATRLDKFGTQVTGNVELLFTSNANVETAITYGTSTSTTSDVAWSEVQRVSMRGKIYTVRQFKALTADMTVGSILNGTRFRFRGFDFNADLNNEWVVDPADVDSDSFAINADDVLVLLATPPFDSVDRITSQYLDITSVLSQTNPFDLFYDSGEFYVFEDILKTTYPPIRPI